jgi:hypothetical protein
MAFFATAILRRHFARDVNPMLMPIMQRKPVGIERRPRAGKSGFTW